MITLGAAVNEFLLAKRADGLKNNSLQWYQGILTPLITQLGPDLRLRQVDAARLRAYVVDLRSRSERYQHAPKRLPITGGLADDTIRSHLRGLTAFFSWCMVEYNLPSNPMSRIRKPRPPRKEPKAIAQGDLRRLIQACEDTPIGCRDRAILAFLAETGCRAGGLLTLSPAQLDLLHRRAMIVEKGDKTRVVFFTPFTATLLRCWLAVRPPKADYVFCSLRNTEIGAPLGISGLNQALKRLARKAGVKGRVNPHSFRHAFARHYLENGGDLATLAQLMGHADVAVTASNYAVFTDEELALLHQQHGPHIESLVK